MKRTFLQFALIFQLITSYGYGQSLTDVFFSDPENGTVVGFGLINDGIIARTTNGGLNWNYQLTAIPGWVYAVSFPNVNTGTVVGGGPALILRTTNGGLNWNQQVAGVNATFHDVFFTDTNTGTAVGSNSSGGIIIHTTNGGLNWHQQSISVTQWLWGVFFTDSNTGTAVGDDGVILYTTNGGLNWNQQTSGTIWRLTSAFYITANTGIVVGYSGTAGIILRTTNSGINWSQQVFPGKLLRNVCFPDANTGIVSGNPAIILRTTNGGVNWNEITTGFNFSVGSVSFPNVNTGTLLGVSGIILRTTNGGFNWSHQWLTDVNTISSEIPNNFSLSQNYPNPFNPQTKIKFDVPKASFTKLIVYDLLGREVTTLVNEELRPGTYEADWDASNFPSGVYFYKITSGEFAQTKKMVLIK